MCARHSGSPDAPIGLAALGQGLGSRWPPWVTNPCPQVTVTGTWEVAITWEERGETRETH